MPCNNITELLSVHLDNEDRLIFYSLSKQSCGGPVGRPALLRKWVKGKTPSEILAISSLHFSQELRTKSTTWEWLYLKHLFALQAGLKQILGLDESTRSRFCEIASIEQLDDFCTVTAIINIDVLTEEIRACTGCSC